MGEPVLILGASVRAAAWSARRAGLDPVGADLFGDVDMAMCGPITVVAAHEYPDAFERFIGLAPPGPWMYTGALENRPDLLDRIAAGRTLWGNSGDAVRPARDPAVWGPCVRQAGLACPAWCRDAAALPRDGSWLVKPLHSAGGRGIRPLVADTRFKPASVYFQQRIRGRDHSLLFVGNGHAAALLGVTRQLVGDRTFHARPFRYCGSVGPCRLPEPLADQCRALGNALARQLGLTGLFGIDGVVAEGRFWPVEVNPRYTASAEVIECATGLAMVGAHRRACVDGVLPELAEADPGGSAALWFGKAVLYAPRDLIAPDWTARIAVPRGGGEPRTWPTIADVPRPGCEIAAGTPVLTVFASAADETECLLALRARADEIDATLRSSTRP
jgi:predicted ATP-grasp superfamily ATP-dependent carboligase